MLRWRWKGRSHLYNNFPKNAAPNWTRY